MPLRSLILERYKVFKERHRIELAPLTVVIGKNGSGKSVLTRLPLLLSQSISERPNGPLDLSAGGVDHGASFQDLVHSRSALPFSLGIEVVEDGNAFEFLTTLRYVSERRALVIEKFELWESKISKLTIDLSAIEQLVEPNPAYLVTASVSTEKPTIPIEFSGLLPKDDGLPKEAAAVLAHAVKAFRNALPPPSYLGPFRSEPARVLKTPSQSIPTIGPRGEHALELLAHDELRQRGELSKLVAAWFANATAQFVKVDVSGEYLVPYIVSKADGFRSNLSDTGAGFSQSIPVVVQNIAYQIGALTSNVLIAEQPELHLHPAAHGHLADLYQSSAQPNSPEWQPAICIVETHSEQFITRLRRRIAEGLDPSKVKVLSLGHTDSLGFDEGPVPLKEITFDSDGNPSSWPSGVFEEALEDVEALRRAQRKRS